MRSSHNSLRKPFSPRPGRPRRRVSCSAARLPPPDVVRWNILNNFKFGTSAGDGRTCGTMPAEHSLIANEDIVEQVELNETE